MFFSWMGKKLGCLILWRSFMLMWLAGADDERKSCCSAPVILNIL